jgi:hypothetical protein
VSVFTYLRNEDGTLRAGPHLTTGRPAHDLAFTRDGRTLFASEDTGHGDIPTVHVIARDPSSGALASVGYADLPSYASRYEPEAYGLALAPDDRFLYVADGELVHVFRLGGGPPVRIQSARPECYCVAESLAIAPQGDRLYVGPGNLGVFAVDRDTGVLTALPQGDFGVTSGWRAETHRDLVVAPDGKAIYASERLEDVIHEAAPTAEGARHIRDYRDGSEAQGLDHPGALTISPDGRFLYASTGMLYAGRPASGIVVFRRDPATNALTFASRFQGPTLFDRPADPPGEGTTVLINGGAPYTNDPRVTLTILAGVGVRELEIANDRAMRNARRVALSPDERYRWTLRSAGPERRPRTVYVRSLGSRPATIVTDEVILDRTPPRVLSAAPLRAAPWRLRVIARDRAAGIAGLQLARSNFEQLPWAPARRRETVVELPLGARWVRVVDRAGNRSAWRRISRRR